ncbi:type VI secretion protein ImpA [Scandinavium sp.]|uniref:type VI secretion protein ImpA n=1 Tax=Scandinavium sp. TaxID=2830653 RepID=UPI00289CE56B|nr:type VI secretion protein ImpA [Scandinavium sp.]
MAILHPQECYLLEQFSSAEHIAATRDAIIEFIDAHEAAYARYQAKIPVRSRSEPLWKQADVVWGNRVLPNIRTAREQYINAYIYRTHDDPLAFRIGHTMNDFDRGISEFWDGWMTDEEQTRIVKAKSKATRLDQQLSTTVSGMWEEGDLTYLGANYYFRLNELPKRLPRYELDKNVRIEIGQLPTQAGIYLPDVEFAAAQLLYPDPETNMLREARQGVRRSDWVNEKTGRRDYSWEEARWAETGWTLIRRVEGEYIDVPPEGFFPNGTPDELYSWPEREKNYISREGGYISAWSGEEATHTGDWSVFTGNEMKHVNLRKGERLPYLPGENNSQQRACWTLVKREDGGSVFRDK